ASHVALAARHRAGVDPVAETAGSRDADDAHLWRRLSRRPHPAARIAGATARPRRGKRLFRRPARHPPAELIRRLSCCSPPRPAASVVPDLGGARSTFRRWISGGPTIDGAAGGGEVSCSSGCWGEVRVGVFWACR